MLAFIPWIVPWIVIISPVCWAALALAENIIFWRKKMKRKFLSCFLVFMMLVSNVCLGSAWAGTPVTGHKYELGEDKGAWSSGTAIPYGQIVALNSDNALHLYKLTGASWGLGSSTDSVSFGWDTTNNCLNTTGSDITINYDNTKAAEGRKEISTSGTVTETVFMDISTTADYTDGGALYISSSIDLLTADFISNSLSRNVTENYAINVHGGAIYNAGTITSITGDYYNNSAAATNSTSNVQDCATAESDGGAIYNSGKIGTVTADFIGNSAKSTNSAIVIDTQETYDKEGAYSYSYGGAIFNCDIDYVKPATIDLLDGDFIGNFSVTEGSESISAGKLEAIAFGGAIYNYGQGDTYSKIGKITGDFIGNYSKVTMTSTSGSASATNASAYGGAISNQGSNTSIGTIEGNFIGNSANSLNSAAVKITADKSYANAYSNGGAISNRVSATIDTIKGNFIGNFANTENSATTSESVTSVGAGAEGGAISNGSTIGTIEGNFIGNYAKSVYNGSGTKPVAETGSVASDANGGAIVNTGKITSIIGKFTGNYTESSITVKGTSYACGGAIYNGGTIDSIKSEGFSANTVTSTIGDKGSGVAYAEGGTLYNAGTITTLAGNFTGINTSGKYDAKADATDTNDMSESTGSQIPFRAVIYGGAIYNSGTITTLSGDFSKFSSYATATSKGIDSYAEAKVHGGAVNNHEGTIGSLTGNFSENKITATSTATDNATNNSNEASALGGALMNYNGTIGSITGSFTKNSVDVTRTSGTSSASQAGGGAIANATDGYKTSTTTINSIKGDFSENTVTLTGGTIAAAGGAIANFYGGTIGSITDSSFSKNTVESKASQTNDTNVSALGGAIYNYGDLSIVAASKDITFTENKATSTTGDAKGGAIINSGTLTITARGGNVTFTGNTVSSESAKALGGAIYNANGKVTVKKSATETEIIETTGKLYLNASAGKTIKFEGSTNDSTDSVYNSANIYVNSDGSTGTVSFLNLEDDETPSGTLNVLNGTAEVRGTFSQATINVADGASFNYANDTASATNTATTFNLAGALNLNDASWDGMTAPTRSSRTLALSGTTFTGNGGSFVINTNLADTGGATGDVINLNYTNVSGDVKIKVAYDPFFKDITESTKLTGNHTFLTFGTTTNGSLNVASAPTYHSNGGGSVLTITPLIAKNDDGSWQITSLSATSGASETTKAVVDSATAVSTAWVQSVSSLQKRLGDLRSGVKSDTGWVHFQHDNDDINTGSGGNISGNLYQIGYDFLASSNESSRTFLGLSLDYFDGTQSYKIGGGDIKSTTFSAYFTKVFNSGHYYDFVVRFGKFDSDVKSYDSQLEQYSSLDYTSKGFTLSGEYGYRMNLGRKGFYFEPQAELIYGHLGGDSVRDSNNNAVEIDSTNHFIGRAGFALGQRVKNFNYYLRTSYYHDFASSNSATYVDTKYEEDGAKNWFEVSLGGGWQLGKASYFYAEFIKHFKDISNSLNFNLGFRFTL